MNDSQLELDTVESLLQLPINKLIQITLARGELIGNLHAKVASSSSSSTYSTTTKESSRQQQQETLSIAVFPMIAKMLKNITDNTVWHELCSIMFALPLNSASVVFRSGHHDWQREANFMFEIMKQNQNALPLSNSKTAVTSKALHKTPLGVGKSLFVEFELSELPFEFDVVPAFDGDMNGRRCIRSTLTNKTLNVCMGIDSTWGKSFVVAHERKQFDRLIIGIGLIGTSKWPSKGPDEFFISLDQQMVFKHDAIVPWIVRLHIRNSYVSFNAGFTKMFAFDIIGVQERSEFELFSTQCVFQCRHCKESYTESNNSANACVRHDGIYSVGSCEDYAPTYYTCCDEKYGEHPNVPCPRARHEEEEC